MTPETRLKLAVAGIVGLAVLPWIATLALDAARARRVNYRGERILTAFGLVVVAWSVCAYAALLLKDPVGRRETAAFLAIAAGFGALGLLDDLVGDRKATGLRGHLMALLQHGRLTTGLVKAVGGLALAVAVPRIVLREPLTEACVDGLLIALSANAINLLDLRPGRACAAFLVTAVALCAWQFSLGPTPTMPRIAFAIIPAILVYERDARARVMLGDTGSNPMGALLGLTFALHAPSLTARVIALAMVATLTLVAERWSLSAIIEHNPVLRRLDALTGRR